MNLSRIARIAGSASRPVLASICAFASELPQNGQLWAYHIRGIAPDDSLYLSRTIFPRAFGMRPLLHRIWRADADRYMHNHPWAWARFLIVSGGYTEERLCEDGYSATLTRYRTGDVNQLTASTFHRVLHVLPDTWTIGIAGPRVQEWGFRVDGEIIPSKVYFEQRGHAQTTDAS